MILQVSSLHLKRDFKAIQHVNNWKLVANNSLLTQNSSYLSSSHVLTGAVSVLYIAAHAPTSGRLVWSCLVWSGLAWSGLVWSGLAHQDPGAGAGS